MLSKRYIFRNKVNIAILLFLAIFVSIHMTKPTIFYNEDGGFRQFGVGYSNKTVIPIWVIAIILAVLCYLAVLYFLAYW
jgi:hypothetical protein